MPTPLCISPFLPIMLNVLYKYHVLHYENPLHLYSNRKQQQNHKFFNAWWHEILQITMSNRKQIQVAMDKSHDFHVSN
jgi:hypothetical protein